MSWIFVKQSGLPWTPAESSAELTTHFDLSNDTGYTNGQLLASGDVIASDVAGSSDTLVVWENSAGWTDTMAYSANAINGLSGIGLNSRLSNGRGQLLLFQTSPYTYSNFASVYGKSDVIVGVVASIATPGTSVRSTLMSQRASTGGVTKEFCGIYREVDGTITLSTKRTSSDTAKAIVSSTAMSDNTAMLFVARLNFQGGQAELRLNGTSEGTATYDAAGVSESANDFIYNYHTLGGDGVEERTWVGKFGEVVAISQTSGEIASGQMEKLEGYLAHKWGLTASLPSTHPYKTAAPTV